MQPPAPVTWLSRVARGRSYDARDEPLLSGTDGRRVYVPPALQTTAGGGYDGLFRLLAVEQAARLVRGTPRAFSRIEKGETRDWFLLAEAATIDRWIATEMPGLVPALSARAHASHGAVLPRGTPSSGRFGSPRRRSSDAAVPLARRRFSRRIARMGPVANGPRAGQSAIREPTPWYWGRVLAASESIGPVAAHGSVGNERRARSSSARACPRVRRRPRVREAAEDEDDNSPQARG